MIHFYKLSEYLKNDGQKQLTLTFAKIEEIIGEDLPEKAKTSKSWWSNIHKSVKSSTWMKQDYIVVDPKGVPIRHNVTFKKIESSDQKVITKENKHYKRVWFFLTDKEAELHQKCVALLEILIIPLATILSVIFAAISALPSNNPNTTSIHNSGIIASGDVKLGVAIITLSPDEDFFYSAEFMNSGVQVDGSMEVVSNTTINHLKPSDLLERLTTPPAVIYDDEYNTAQEFIAQRNYPAAIKSLQAALDACIKYAPLDNKSRAFIYYDLGFAQNKIRNYVEAISCYNQAAGIFKNKLDNTELDSKIFYQFALFNVANAYYASQQYEYAVNACHQAIELSEEIGDQKSVADAYLLLNYIYVMSSDTFAFDNDSAIFYGEQALALYGTLGDDEGIAESCLMLGAAYTGKGTNDLETEDDRSAYLNLALECYLRAFRIYREANYAIGMLDTIQNAFIVYSYQNDYMKALHCYQEARKAYKVIDDTVLLEQIFNGFGYHHIAGTDMEIVQDGDHFTVTGFYEAPDGTLYIHLDDGDLISIEISGEDLETIRSAQ